MTKSLPLGTRLVILGVSGPLVSTLLLLGGASTAAVVIARKASIEISSLFQQDNRENLLHTTALIQAAATRTSEQLILDAEAIRRNLQGLAITGSSSLTWQGQRFESNQAATLLNDLLRQPLSIGDAWAGIYFKNGQGQWHRLTGITRSGEPLQMNWQAPIETVRELEALYLNREGLLTPRNTLLRRGDQWRVTRLTPLNGTPQGRRLVVMVSVSTDAATGLLNAGSNLFPREDHEVAFFGWTPTGTLYCNYQRPRPTTCRDLQASLAATGGIPRPGAGQQPALMERQLPLIGPDRRPLPRRSLFVATFPTWNWVAAIAVNEDVLQRTLTPLRRETSRVITGLIGLSLLLMLGCGLAAWHLARGVTRQLQQLAEAADAIASDQKRQTLRYGADDAIGQLVLAFNRMASAVADREEGLRAQIQELTISINHQSLQGQVCSIVADPSFSALSERAQAMRQRRRQFRDATPPEAGASDGSSDLASSPDSQPPESPSPSEGSAAG